MSSSYTWDEVRQHTSPGDLWLVIDNKVYDVSQWMDEHPGGDFVLLQEAGKDATAAFALEGIVRSHCSPRLSVSFFAHASWMPADALYLLLCMKGFRVLLCYGSH